MSQEILIRCLRPQLFRGFKRSQWQSFGRTLITRTQLRSVGREERIGTHDFEKRITQLQAEQALPECYPRLTAELQISNRSRSESDFLDETSSLEPNQTKLESTVIVAGRISSIRIAGSSLCFIDVDIGNGSTVQVVCQLAKLAEGDPSITKDVFKAFRRMARKGDHYHCQGNLHRTARGEPSILATKMPRLLSPSLHQIPEVYDDPETRARNRHVDMLVNSTVAEPIMVRHELEHSMHKFFYDREFIRVNTPIISAGAGGANARPFETEATEFTGEKLSLRIAPELWLKRLIVGGMKQIYEIGPVFRNEGVDFTHNPEFQICEFYEAYATLDSLIATTESLFAHIAEAVGRRLPKIPQPQIELTGPFERVEFLPTLETLLCCKIPDLQSADAFEQVTMLLQRKGIPPPTKSSLSRLLDTLSAHYLEPLSSAKPIFITHHPACMSPLSKHCVCPTTGQTVAARAELFINGREYANMYEEENSPFEQRRKFEEQLKQRETDVEAMELDESYLQALEWGMPPTGGWGCGIDRLVMLFSGRERMADVLPFGSLRNVVGLSKVRRR